MRSLAVALVPGLAFSRVVIGTATVEAEFQFIELCIPFGRVLDGGTVLPFVAMESLFPTEDALCKSCLRGPLLPGTPWTWA